MILGSCLERAMNEDIMLLRHLEGFVAVAEELSFTRAAERLYMAQPALSRYVQAVEEELGVVLLSRSSRRVELTDAGRVYLEEVRGILASLQEARYSAQSAADGMRGRLSIGVTGFTTGRLLAQIIRPYRETHPSVNIRLRPSSYSGELVTEIQEGSLEVALIRAHPEGSGVDSREILREPLVAAVPAGHLLEGRSSVSLRDLSGESFVAYPSRRGSELRTLFDEACHLAGFKPEIGAEHTDSTMTLTLVGSGVGIALLPESVQSMQMPGVAYVTLRDPQPTLPVVLAWAGRSSTLVRGFLRVGEEVFPPTLDSGAGLAAPDRRRIGGS